MSTNIDIFVDAQTGLEEFAAELEILLQIKLTRIDENAEIYYAFRNSQIDMTLGTHEFDNDRDMNFEDYNYDISVRALNLESEEKRKQWRERFAFEIFEKLKATDKYDLMMIENIQIKLAEFHPKSS